MRLRCSEFRMLSLIAHMSPTTIPSKGLFLNRYDNPVPLCLHAAHAYRTYNARRPRRCKKMLRSRRLSRYTGLLKAGVRNHTSTRTIAWATL